MQNTNLIQPILNQPVSSALRERSDATNASLQDTMFEKLSDRELYEKCSFFGAQARKWANKFAALLPEVEKRALYKKHGFYSIFEFAAKLARMNHETVIEILRISKRLEGMPLLLEQIETQGWSKLKVVATIATKENEKMLAEKVCQMSRSTLAIFVNEIRKQNEMDVQNRTGAEVCKNIEAQNVQVLNLNSKNSQQNLLDCRNSLDENSQFQGQANEENSQSQLQPSGPSRIYVRLLLKPETELRLKELQKKMSKKIGAPVDLNEVMEALLNAYAGEQKSVKKMATDKVEKVKNKPIIVSTAIAKPAILGNSKINKKTVKNKITKEITRFSRYILVKIKKILYAKYGGRCAFPGCNKLPEIYHHTRRFSLYPNHDPDSLTPLCLAHERLAHHGLIENEEEPVENWRIRFEPDKNHPKYAVDSMVQKFRSRASARSC